MWTAVVLLLAISVAGDSIRHEAEDAFQTTSEESLVCESAGTVGLYSSLANNTKIVFTVSIPTQGDFLVDLRYISCSNSPTSIKIYANGIFLLDSDLMAVAEYSTKTHSLNLRRGLNTIAYEIQGGNIAFDYIDVQGGFPLAPQGANPSYSTYEAEKSKYTGSLIGPSMTYLTLPAEASGRQAIQFTKSGDNVEFTLTQSTNAIVVRYSIPDSSDGSGQTANLGLYINGVHETSLVLTSRYSWLYGTFPFTKNPGDGSAHHFYDDVRYKIGRTLNAGTVIRVQGESAVEYTIDFLEAYDIDGPLSQPSGYISVTNFGADPSGKADSFNAFNAAIRQAQNNRQGIWVPQGTFYLSHWVQVQNDVTIRGAGPWYTELHGNDVGIYGYWTPPSQNIGIYDIAFFGQTRTRNDSENSSGVGGALGGGSVVQNVWIEHNKCGMWLDGPFNSLLVSGCVIRNTFADGINLHKGISNAIVEQTNVRNTGDDCLAMWPQQPNAYGPNTFRSNTVQLPILANTIAVYGGNGNTVSNNLCLDTVNFGGGIQVGNRFGSVPLSGTTNVQDNTLIRTGSTGQGQDVNFGALWFYTADGPMDGSVQVNGAQIEDSFYSGIQFFDKSITNVVITNVNITGAVYAIDERAPGSATFNYVRANSLSKGGQRNCGVSFKAILGPGNSGISDVSCN